MSKRGHGLDTVRAGPRAPRRAGDGAYRGTGSEAKGNRETHRKGNGWAPYSAYNAVTSTPPTIAMGVEYQGNLTKNRNLPNAVDPDELLNSLAWLRKGRSGDHSAHS